MAAAPETVEFGLFLAIFEFRTRLLTGGVTPLKYVTRLAAVRSRGVPVVKRDL